METDSEKWGGGGIPSSEMELRRARDRVKRSNRRGKYRGYRREEPECGAGALRYTELAAAVRQRERHTDRGWQSDDVKGGSWKACGNAHALLPTTSLVRLSSLRTVFSLFFLSSAAATQLWKPTESWEKAQRRTII